MTAYKLGQTLSTNGTVTRGICDIDGEYMRGVTECYDITADCVGNLNGKTTTIDKDAPISMNLWALTTDVFDRLEEQFAEFKTEADLTKDEFLLPTVINKPVSYTHLTLPTT